MVLCRNRRACPFSACGVWTNGSPKRRFSDVVCFTAGSWYIPIMVYVYTKHNGVAGTSLSVKFEDLSVVRISGRPFFSVHFTFFFVGAMYFGTCVKICTAVG